MGLSPAEWNALCVSLWVAATAVVVSLPAGIAIGWVLARKQFPGKLLVESAVNLPLVLPPVVTGYFLLVLFGKNGSLGRWLDAWFGVRFVFDWKGAAVAAAVVAFPLMVRSIRLSFLAVDPRLEQAARTLGAGRWDAFRTISLPLARDGVIAGSILAFARGMGEFGATVMIAGNIAGETQTIPLFIYDQLETPGGLERSGTIILVSVLVATAALVAGEILERRGRRRLRMD